MVVHSSQHNPARWQPGDLVVGLAVLIPVLQWLPLKAGTEHHVATYTSMTLWMVTGLGVVAAWVARKDLWLGLLMAWFDLQILFYQTTEVVETALLLTLGAVALVSMQEFDARRRGLVRTALLVAAAGQALLACAESIWFPLAGIPLAAWGTLGNGNFLGVYLAIVAPLAPLWLLPLLCLGLLASKCLVGVVALSAGLAVRYGRQAWPWLGLGGALFAAVVLLKQQGAFLGLAARLQVAALVLGRVAGSGWEHWLAGYGPGRWKVLVPLWQLRAGAPQSNWFIEAHNDWLQLLFEGGAKLLSHPYHLQVAVFVVVGIETFFLLAPGEQRRPGHQNHKQ